MIAHTADFSATLLAAANRRRRTRLLQQWLLGVGFPVVCLAVWQLLAQAGTINETFFPAPTRVVSDMVSQLSSQAGLSTMGADLGITLRDLAIAFVLGSVLGMAAGLALGLSRRLSWGWTPLLYATYPTPKVILYPLCLVVFGLGESTSVVLATLTIFYIVAVTTLAGVRTCPVVYHEVGAVFGVPRRLRHWKIVGLSAWQPIVTGFKLAIGEGLVLILAMEFINSTNGMGAYINTAWEDLDVGQVFVGLVVVAIVGGLLALACNQLERLAVPWARRQQ
jgi:ABC-type nitrate/sulfonate/bicarbonate transport system permease component